MYIIVAGVLRVHDGAHTFSQMGAREVFGEMALLDAGPRSTSATASEDALLLRLNREDLFELMDDHSAIARGIIQVLSQRLRARTEDLSRLHTQTDTTPESATKPTA
jgi:CRP-like cAMP-binding protein